MVAFSRISHFSLAARYSELLDEMLQATPGLPLGVRLRLAEDANARAAALSLALCHVISRTRRPTLLTLDLFQRLMECQHVDGSFGGPAANALVIRALEALRAQVVGLPARDRYSLTRTNPNLVPSIEQAIDSASYILRLAQLRAGVHGVGDETDSALVLWALRRVDPARLEIDLESLRCDAEAVGLFHDDRFERMLGAPGEARVAGPRAA